MRLRRMALLCFDWLIDGNSTYYAYNWAVQVTAISELQLNSNKYKCKQERVVICGRELEVYSIRRLSRHVLAGPFVPSWL